MGKYIKKFETNSERAEYEGSNSYIEPYVSYVEENGVHYNITYKGFCKLTLQDDSIVELEGSGELTSSMIDSYKSEIVAVEIGKLCTSVGTNAFKDCSNLTNISIPDSVTSIGSGALAGTNALKVLNYNAKYSLNSSFRSNWPVLETLIIGNSTPTIGDYAFTNCTGLTSIIIPDSVTRIGNSAFNNCRGLTSVVIGNSVTSIGGGTFAGCNGLTSITIPDSVTSIGSSAFSNCTGLTNITIPDSVTTIGADAFSGCSGLTNITIGNGVTSIDMNAFQGTNALKVLNYNAKCELSSSFNNLGWSNLETVIIGDSTQTIGAGVLGGCGKLTSVTIGNSVTSIGAGALSGCGNLTSIIIGNSVTSIGAGAFGGCASLTSITIPDSVTTISDGAFQSTGLTSITIPSGVTSISQYTFSRCTSLTSITIPDSVTSIGISAFDGCTGLTSVIIGNSVTSINSKAFAGCAGLISITSLATTAPTITSSTFNNIKTGGTLTVPSGSTGYDAWMSTNDYYLGKYNWTKVEQ